MASVGTIIFGIIIRLFSYNSCIWFAERVPPESSTVPCSRSYIDGAVSNVFCFFSTGICWGADFWPRYVSGDRRRWMEHYLRQAGKVSVTATVVVEYGHGYARPVILQGFVLDSRTTYCCARAKICCSKFTCCGCNIIGQSELLAPWASLLGHWSRFWSISTILKRFVTTVGVAAAAAVIFVLRWPRCVTSGAKIILSKLPVGDLATQFFADRNLFCAGRVPHDDMERVAKVHFLITYARRQASCGYSSAVCLFRTAIFLTSITVDTLAHLLIIWWTWREVLSFCPLHRNIFRNYPFLCMGCSRQNVPKIPLKSYSIILS